MNSMNSIRRKILAQKNSHINISPSGIDAVSKGGKLKDVLEVSVKGVTLITGLAFILSIAFDSAYFYWLGITIGSAPTSLTDHIRTTLQWLPLLVIAAPILVGANAQMVLWDARLSASSAARRAAGKAERGYPNFWLNDVTPLGRLGIMCFLPTLFGVLVGGSSTPFQFFIFPALFLLVFDRTWRLLPDDPRELSIKTGLLSACMGVGLFLFIGISQANRDILRPAFQRNVVLKGSNNSLKTVDYLPLRQFEKFYLMLDKDSRPVFVKTDDVIEVYVDKKILNEPGVICRTIGYVC